MIALLTDFGVKDYFVGAMKGAIFSINWQAQIIDITHEIAAQNIASASFVLRACYRNFPSQTIFVAVVDPGVGSQRHAILAATADYFFIAPDNGLLSFVFDEAQDFHVFKLENEKFFAEKVSRTFHGRDVFAPVAAHLSNGVALHEFGAETKSFVRLPEMHPQKISADTIEAQIIHTDNFGNLITNLRRTDLPEKFTLEVGGKTINRLQNFFAEAATGELLMFVGSAGFLEIAACKASAQKILRLDAGAKIKLTVQT